MPTEVSAVEQQARAVVDAFRFASPPVQSLRFLEWEPLVHAIIALLQEARQCDKCDLCEDHHG